jgi:hypothetical protein
MLEIGPRKKGLADGRTGLSSRIWRAKNQAGRELRKIVMIGLYRIKAPMRDLKLHFRSTERNEVRTHEKSACRIEAIDCFLSYFA